MPAAYDDTSPALRHLRRRDSKLAAVIDAIGPLDCAPPDATPFEFLCFHIVGQMLSTKAADVIYARLRALVGNDIAPGRVRALSADELRGIGLSRRKAEYMLGLADTVLAGGIDFQALSSMPDTDVMRTLTALRGVGAWTAKMYLIFMLGREDVLPVEDGAFMQAWRWAYGEAGSELERVREKAARWAPYRSVGARYLYRALDTGLTKTPWEEFARAARGRAGRGDLPD